jgi:hypothetical protein
VLLACAGLAPEGIGFEAFESESLAASSAMDKDRPGPLRSVGIESNFLWDMPKILKIISTTESGTCEFDATMGLHKKLEARQKAGRGQKPVDLVERFRYILRHDMKLFFHSIHFLGEKMQLLHLIHLALFIVS